MTKIDIDQTAMALDLQVGHRLRELRKAAGLTQTELGDAVGVSFQQVQKYERGTNRISASTLILMAKALKIDPRDLLAGVRDDLMREEGADLLGAFLAHAYGPRLMRALLEMGRESARLLAEVAESLAVADEARDRAG